MNPPTDTERELPSGSGGDWPTQHEENGNYQGHCCVCNRTYIGPKRSVTCYACHQEGVEAWNKLSPEQQQEHQRTLALEYRRVVMAQKGDK